ncbi:MAG TPA: hypothetical protein VIM80_03765 [Brevefilum sp.]
MTEEKKPVQGELKVLDFGGKILSVYRRCSCGGDVSIKKDDTELNIAECKVCGARLEWRDGDKLPGK